MRIQSYILCIVILLISSISSTSLAQWKATVTATKEGGARCEGIFGVYPSASDGLDQYDIPIPGEPPGIVTLYMAFQIDGIIPYLIKDIKHESYPKQWTLYIYSQTGSMYLTWDISSIPSHKFVLLDNSGETVNMRSEDSLSLALGHHSLILTVTDNTPPVADDQSVVTDEDTPVAIILTGSDAGGDPLVYAVVNASSNGSLTGTAPYLTYTPDANFNGSDSFTFKVNDGTSDSNIATVSITVNPVNDPPVADSQSVITGEDIPVAITLIANDVDGDELTYTIVDAPSNGSLTGTAPYLTYVPDANFNGSDSFTFRVNDGTSDSNIAAVSITVNSLEDPPVADDQSVVTDEDTPAAIILTGSDVEGSPLTYAVVNTSSDGSLTGTAPNLTYVPDANFNGSDSFTFKVNDGTSDSNIATVSITVNPVNDPPVADSQSTTTDEDIPVAITLFANDIDGDELTYTIVDAPSNGSLTGTAPNLTYVPDANFNGSDSFTFKANDGTSDSNIAVVSILVGSVDDPPVADDQSVVTDEDTPVAIILTGTDLEGSPLTYAVVNTSSDGSLTGTAPYLTYTPDANFNGSDSFTFKVNDGTSDSNIATVSITVNPVNDPPVVGGQSVITGEDIPVAITLIANDIDGDELTYTIVDAPSNGSLTGTAPDLTYIPDANFNGSDSFTFKVNDGTSDSNIATVSITVNSREDPPVADDQSVVTDEDTPAAIILTSSDADGDQLAYAVVNGTSNGSLTGTAPDLTYAPDANFNGSDSFTFKANDGTFDSNIATVNITVNPVNDPPVADSQSVITDEDIPVAIILTGSDVEEDLLIYTIVDAPSNGFLTGTAPDLTYIPDANFNGSDSFTFKVNDGTSDSNIATVSITVNSREDPPVADDQSVVTDEDTPAAIILTSSDADGDQLAYAVVNGTSNGSLTGTAPDLTYAPDANFNGSDSFTFKANDGTFDSNIATVNITVNPVNDPPVADSQSVITDEDIPVAIILTGSDIEEDLLTYIIVDTPSNGFFMGRYFPSKVPIGSDAFGDLPIDADVSFNGFLTGMAPNLTYVPDANFNGSDSFTFKANDGTSDSNIATVSITVNSREDPPVADDQSVVTDEDTPAAIILTSSDADGDQLTYAVVNGTSNGSLTGTAPGLTYTPDVNFNGSDSFTFRVNDGTSDSNIATVNITVNPVNDPPVADDLSVITDEDHLTSINLSGADTEGDRLTYSIVNEPANGMVVDLAEVSPKSPGWGYIPDSNFNGSDSFTFKANDGTSDSNIATVSITVNPVNDPPVADNQSLITTANFPIAVILTASDVDGDLLTYSVVHRPSNGSLNGTVPDLAYMPDPDFNGSDSFSFRANDGSIDSNIALVNIRVDDNPDNLTVGLSIMSLCPVDMVVVDPRRQIISKDMCTIPSASYIEEDLNEDGDPDDMVAIPNALTGIYSIEIVPEPGADPSDTYTLRVFYGNMPRTLAENVEVRDIPTEPYSFFFPLRKMSAGWNLISLPMEPLDANIDSVLSSIQGKYGSIWRYEPLQGWFCHLPDALEEVSPWLMEPGIGYWVMMDMMEEEYSYLFIQSKGILGAHLPAANAIPLYAGWNLVGYNSLVSKPIEGCMSSVQGKFALVWSYDPDRGWLWYTPDAPEQSTLRSMEPGKGYLIKATEDCIWDTN